MLLCLHVNWKIWKHFKFSPHPYEVGKIHNIQGLHHFAKNVVALGIQELCLFMKLVPSPVCVIFEELPVLQKCQEWQWKGWWSKNDKVREIIHKVKFQDLTG